MEFAESIADIVVFGGSAGGGKTRSLVYDPVSKGYHENPGFTGVIFRETFPEIMEAGGPWNEATEVYPWLGAKGVVGAHEYRFPSGAIVAFRHLDDEQTKYKYKGAQFCYLAFDELTGFSESQFWYLVSRNRSTCGIRPYIRCTCNPDPGWVKTSLLAPWVDREYPGKRAESCELRWIRRGDKPSAKTGQYEIEWYDHPVPDAKTLTFIRSKLTDNPALLEKNPEYEANLKILLPVERERLLYGNWDIRREGLVYPTFEQCIVSLGPDVVPHVGGMDFGIHNPFAALWGHIDHDGVLWVTGCRYKAECTIALHSQAIPRNVTWHCDPSGTEQWRQLREAGHEMRPCVHLPTRYASGEKKNPKLSGIDMVTRRMETGRLKIVRNEGTMWLIRELGGYHYDETKKVEEPVDEDNHACDALRYLVVGIDRGRSVPSIVESESDLDRLAREEARVQDEYDRRKAEDIAAQADPFNPRWGM